MEYIIKNDQLIVGLKSLGAEITSIKDMDGVEYLWQGDKTYWGGQAPVLFPIVGTLFEGKALLKNGNTTTMGRHGIIRNQEFELIEQKEDEITFSIHSNDELFKQYPFQFEVQIRYKVEGKKVLTQYHVFNQGTEVMPYAIGGHPAFHCPILPGEKFEDYCIEFECEETASCPAINMDDGTLDTDNRREVIKESKEIPLTHEIFVMDAMVFDQLKSRTVKCYNKSTGKGIGLDFHGMNYLGIWSASTTAAFVALEPWTGMASRTDEGEFFDDKIGMVGLPPSSSKITSFTIEVL